MESQPILIEPEWPAPANVIALSTTRRGGRSLPPYRDFNLAYHVGDDPHSVEANRKLLLHQLTQGTRICWLNQVHGSQVVKARGDTDEMPPAADGSWSNQPGLACAVMTADCLPVLFCTFDGSCVAAAHAGWRGLHKGVLEATIAAMDVPAEQVIAWLGPAIGPSRFEVGPEVRDAFVGAPQHADARVASCFRPSPARDEHFLADLYALARLRLSAGGVAGVYGGNYCTFDDEDRFFSYRRDGTTGRMATLVALRPALEKQRFAPI